MNPAFRIIDAIANLQAAFESAGLLVPIAIVVPGEIERRQLESYCISAMGVYPNGRPWEMTSIRGLKIMSDVAA